MKTIWNRDTPLKDLLKLNGLTYGEVENGVKNALGVRNILRDGKTVFTGRAHDVSRWLKNGSKEG
jgi:hypothetical protein